MGLIKTKKSLARELSLMKSVLEVSKKRDMRDSSTGKLLINKGLISKVSGKITKKGREAIKYL